MSYEDGICGGCTNEGMPCRIDPNILCFDTDCSGCPMLDPDDIDDEEYFGEAITQLVEDEWWREEGFYTWVNAHGNMYSRYCETEQELIDELKTEAFPLEREPEFQRA